MPKQEIILSRALYPNFHSSRCVLSDNETGEADPIGQILIQLGHNPDRMRLPSELKTLITPFTTKVRSRIIDTPLTHSLLNAFTRESKDRDALIEQLLSPYYTLTIE